MTTPLWIDGLYETSPTTGTGDYSLSGAVPGYQAFSTLGDGGQIYYAARDIADGGWEIGLGTWHEGNRLSRTTVLASSDSGDVVSWPVGTRQVFCVVPASVISSSLFYSNSNPTPQTVGGISAGSTFDGVPVGEILDRLLYPYQAPAFTYFSWSSYLAAVEVGVTVSISQFSWSSSNMGNVQAGSVSITDGATVLASGKAASGLVNGSWSYKKVSQGTQNFTVSGVNTKGGSYSATLGVTWGYRQFYGESGNTSLTAGQIVGLRVNNLSSGFSGTYSFQGGGYKYFVWPVSFGIPSFFKDTSTGFGVAMESPVTVAITNSYGVTTTYNVFRTTNILLSAITIQVG